MMKSLVLMAAVAAALAGCADPTKRILYDGQFFRTKAKAVDKTLDTFVLTVKDPGKSLLGARQAAHHEGVRYCVKNFGTSEIIWDIDPLDEQSQPRIVDNAMTFQGKCPQAQRI